MIGCCLEELGEYLFVILDLQFALLYLFLGPLDILLLAVQSTLEGANFFVELTLRYETFLGSAAHLV